MPELQSQLWARRAGHVLLTRLSSHQNLQPVLLLLSPPLLAGKAEGRCLAFLILLPSALSQLQSSFERLLIYLFVQDIIKKLLKDYQYKTTEDIDLASWA